jgi:hypothetical protein
VQDSGDSMLRRDDIVRDDNGARRSHFAKRISD